MWWWEQLPAAALLWLGERIAAVAQRLNEPRASDPGTIPPPSLFLELAAVECVGSGKGAGGDLVPPVCPPPPCSTWADSQRPIYFSEPCECDRAFAFSKGRKAIPCPVPAGLFLRARRAA